MVAKLFRFFRGFQQKGCRKSPDTYLLRADQLKIELYTVRQFTGFRCHMTAALFQFYSFLPFCVKQSKYCKNSFISAAIEQIIKTIRAETLLLEQIPGLRR